MANTDIQEVKVSPHMTSHLFKVKGRRNSRVVPAKNLPNIANTIADLEELHKEILLNVTNYVDLKFPNADFLSQQEGSQINKGTKLLQVLVHIIRGSNLIPMQLPNALVENYRKTVRNFLDKVRNQSLHNDLANKITNMIGILSALSEAIEGRKAAEGEMQRLIGHKQTPRTINIQVLRKHAEELITLNNTLVTRLKKIMQQNGTNESSDDVAKILDNLETSINNIEGIIRQLEAKGNKDASKYIEKPLKFHDKQHHQITRAAPVALK